MINFKVLSTVTALISFILFMLLLLLPQFIFQLFDLVGNEPAYFISRRAAMLFLGYAVITFSTRHAKHSIARQSIALGTSVAMMGLALLGSTELIRGYAGIGILFAIVTEVIISLAYFSIWFANRDKPTTHIN